ncbi:hypothetical protein [Pseudarthrobacter sp. PH31-O2]|uniref:hypothetical protein n=1 Tax=Micrococcaceae TaxID=1268 RepID=UPI0024BA6FE7|nr:hypothetical protein [Pseudarthrobacter sp. PH31-O2]MDJ0354002.1 hypothetical protein [Pseudarthrobacter sp. PH31-O2]
MPPSGFSAPGKSGSAVAFSRSPGQVLNIAYLTAKAEREGGFFPKGVNGEINRSAASA